MFRKMIHIVLALIFIAGSLGPGSTPALAQPAAVGIPLSSVPVQFVRMAAQHLEDMRGSPLAPGWDETADLGPLVIPIYRPDLQAEVAYYEFNVLLGGSKQSGFIIVSTGKHDFPIPHWNSQGSSPTQELDARAVLLKISIAAYYRLDALTYAGEDADGANEVTTNDSLLQIQGLDPASPVPPSSTTNWASTPVSDDGKLSPNNWSPTSAGPQTADYKLAEWPSWKELKSGYGQAYSLFLNHLADSASPEWDTLSSAAAYGELLSKGDVRNIAVLCKDTSSINLSGDGVNFATTGLVTRPGLNPLYNITVTKDEYGVEHPLTVEITCPGSPASTYNYVISPPSFHLLIPLVKKTAGAAAVFESLPAPAAPVKMAPAAPAGPSQVNDWGPWNYYWAFNATADARLYTQMQAGTWNNTSSCYSGCGATAWGMLFGWADYEARSTNTWAYWKPRNGIYRVNGGTGGDAIAPDVADAGVNNMIWEIRNYIHTFCAGSSGATAPWDMSEAWRYLAPRTGTRLDTHYNVIGISEGRLRDYAANSIIYRQTPAVIGTGWLSHYPLAMGYAWTSRTVRACGICWWNTTEYARSFWVNQGWGGYLNGWISADTWFAGEIYP